MTGRMWCHCRMVYLPMSYIYGKRFTGPITNTVKALREEIFIQPYCKIDWNKARNECAKVSLKLFFFFLTARVPPLFVWLLKLVKRHIWATTSMNNSSDLNFSSNLLGVLYAGRLVLPTSINTGHSLGHSAQGSGTHIDALAWFTSS